MAPFVLFIDTSPLVRILSDKKHALLNNNKACFFYYVLYKIIDIICINCGITSGTFLCIGSNGAEKTSS